MTSPAWRCYATGKTPDDIGVYWWRQLNRDTEKFIGADQLPLTDECYWERLSDAGYEVAIMGVPLNSPPQEVDGHFIAGGPFADPNDYTSPASLADTLEKRFNYQLHPREYPSVENATEPEIVNDFDTMINQRFDVAEWILDEHTPDFLNLTLFYINVMQHKAWDAPEVKQLWETIDDRLGGLVNEDDDIIIHSDHGLHEVETVFYMNAWLERQGYLQVDDPDTRRSPVDIARRVTNALGISEQIGELLPEAIYKRIKSGRRLVDSDDYENRIDFEASRAVALPQGPVYVLNDDPEFKDRLSGELESVTEPSSGRHVFNEVATAEDIYGTPLRDDAPDLLAQWNDGFEVKNQHSGDEDMLFGDPVGVLADNAPNGIIIAAGPSFATEDDIETPDLYDLAPTLLHLFDEPVPEDMSGEVASALFASESDAARREPELVAAASGQSVDKHKTATQDVNDRLQDLGYLE